MATADRSDEFRWPALFRRSREPIFVLNRRRQLIFANPAWEALTGVSAVQARGLVCTRRATGHDLADLGRSLVPPPETLKGQVTRARRPFPGTVTGPPWWDIDFVPIMGEDGVSAMIGRIQRLEPTPVAPRTTMPAAWAELRAKAIQAHSFSQWESSNLNMRRAVAQARIAAETLCRAVIVGGPGAGKESLARAIHANSSRRELNCVALDCTRLPVIAIRSVLFGPLGLKHPDWVGLIYLHEPARLPLDLQAEIAAALSDRPQVVFGCAEDPRLAVESGKLHAELYAAMAMLVIELPSLRERRDELAKLIDVIGRRTADIAGTQQRTVTPEAMALLQEHSWPGNLDELTSILLTTSRRPESTTIDIADLPLSMRQAAIPVPGKVDSLPPLDDLLERVERRMIAIALERAKGNKSKAAELLGVWRPRLLRRMEALGIADAGGET